MRAEVWCVIFCTLGTFAFRKESLEKIVLQEICKLKCPPELYYRAWNDSCYEDCIDAPQKIEESLTEKAEANATLVCRDISFIVLGHNPGVFFIDHRLVGDTNWSKAAVTRDPTTCMRKLFPGKPYEYRIRRILASGFSRPEIIGPIESFTATFRNLRKVQNVSMSEFEIETDDPHRLKVDVSFSPSEDQSCFYEVLLCDDNNRNTLMEFNATMELRTTFGSLEFETDYFIEIRSFATSDIASPKTTMEFTTPTCRDFHKNLILCKPARVTGLNATMIRRGENIFDVTLTWNTPTLIPDFYEIHLGEIDTFETKFLNVSGNWTKVIFPEVKIVRISDVSIRAVSPGGASETIYKRLKTPEAPATFLRYIIVALLSSCSAAVVIVCIGIYVCCRHGKGKPDVVESHATFRAWRNKTNSTGEVAPLTLTDLLERRKPQQISNVYV